MNFLPKQLTAKNSIWKTTSWMFDSVINSAITFYLTKTSLTQLSSIALSKGATFAEKFCFLAKKILISTKLREVVVLKVIFLKLNICVC